jgi:hypothetical protein
MLIIKEGLDKQEKRFVENVLYNVVDLYGDFYSTSQNIRISLRDNPDELFKYIKKGSQLVYEPDNENGIALVLKEKGFRTYVKILCKDEDLAGSLLKIMNWNVKCDLYAKIKKNNPLLKVFQRNQYQFLGNRGQEVLLMRKYLARPDNHSGKDEEACELLYRKHKKN